MHHDQIPPYQDKNGQGNDLEEIQTYRGQYLFGGKRRLGVGFATPEVDTEVAGNSMEPRIEGAGGIKPGEIPKRPYKDFLYDIRRVVDIVYKRVGESVDATAILFDEGGESRRVAALRRQDQLGFHYISLIRFSQIYYPPISTLFTPSHS